MDSPNDSKPLREIKQMLNLEKTLPKLILRTLVHILSLLLLMLEMLLEERKEIVHSLTI